MHLTPQSFRVNDALPERYVTHKLKVQQLPPGHSLVDQVFDVANKRTHALYMRESDYPSERALKLTIILDWKSSKSIAFDTGLVRVRMRFVPTT